MMVDRVNHVAKSVLLGETVSWQSAEVGALAEALRLTVTITLNDHLVRLSAEKSLNLLEDGSLVHEGRLKHAKDPG